MLCACCSFLPSLIKAEGTVKHVEMKGITTCFFFFEKCFVLLAGILCNYYYYFPGELEGSFFSLFVTFTSFVKSGE